MKLGQAQSLQGLLKVRLHDIIPESDIRSITQVGHLYAYDVKTYNWRTIRVPAERLL